MPGGAGRAARAAPGGPRRAVVECRGSGYDIRTVSELLGHESVDTTMIHTHVLNRGAKAVRSPLDDRP